MSLLPLNREKLHVVRQATMAMLVALLMGCASTPGLPETTYYRLPPAAEIEPMATPVLSLPITVEAFVADGLYSDQAIIYSLEEDASRLRTYHYQLWIDPPLRLLQRRLMSHLRSTGVSRVVTDRLPAQLETLRVFGRIARLERVKTSSGWEVAVSLVLRADLSSGGKPWVIGEYHRQLPTTDDTITTSVQEFARALDQIYAEFAEDVIATAKAQVEVAGS